MRVLAIFCAAFASGSHEWENRLDHGIWTYNMDDIWGGLQDCYRVDGHTARFLSRERKWGVWFCRPQAAFSSLPNGKNCCMLTCIM